MARAASLAAPAISFIAVATFIAVAFICVVTRDAARLVVLLRRLGFPPDFFAADFLLALGIFHPPFGAGSPAFALRPLQDADQERRQAICSAIRDYGWEGGGSEPECRAISAVSRLELRAQLHRRTQDEPVPVARDVEVT